MKVGFVEGYGSGAQIDVEASRNGWAKGGISGGNAGERRGAVSRRMFFPDHSSNRRARATKVGFMGCHGSGASNDVGASRKGWAKRGFLVEMWVAVRRAATLHTFSLIIARIDMIAR